jgi:hypothetical protein
MFWKGTCCESGWTASYNATFDRMALTSDISAYSATATEARLSAPITSVSHPPTRTMTITMQANVTTSSVEATSTIRQQASGSVGVNAQNNAAPPSTSQTSSGIATVGNSLAMSAMAVVAGCVALF